MRYWKDWSWTQALKSGDWYESIKSNKRDCPLPIKAPKDHKLIQTDEEYNDLLERIEKAPFISYDAEANGLDQFKSIYKVAGLCLATDVIQGYYIPIYHETPDCELDSGLFEGFGKPFRLFDPVEVKQDLLRVGFDKKPIIGHNLKYDDHVLRILDIVHTGPQMDTFLTCKVQDPLRIGRQGLKERVEDTFGYAPINFTESLEGAEDFTKTDPRDSKDYAAADAVNTMRLAYWLVNNSHKKVFDVCETLEYPLVPKLTEVEAFGINIDGAKFEEYERTINPHVQELERVILSILKTDVNLKSPEERYNLVYDYLRCPYPDGERPERKGGTDSSAMEGIETIIPEIIAMLESAHKNLSPFLDGREGIRGPLNDTWDALEKSRVRFQRVHASNTITVDYIKELLDTVEKAKDELSEKSLVIKLISSYNKLVKVLTSFVQGIPKKVSDIDGRLHTEFKQILNSGRMASKTPNLMQLPRDSEYLIPYPFLENCELEILEYEGEEPKAWRSDELDNKFGTPQKVIEKNNTKHIALEIDIRACLLPPPGYVFVLSDWDSMEMKMAAVISQCPVLMSVVTGKDEEGKDLDPHLKAVELMGLAPGMTYEQLKKVKDDPDHPKHKSVSDERQDVKPIQFGTLYGQTVFGLAAALGKSIEEAQEKQDKYFSTYYGVHKWIKDSHSNAERLGYAETKLGRRRYIPEEAYEDKFKLQGFLRACGNHEIQANCADIAKYCVLQICDALKETDGHFANFVHDENITIVRDDPKTVRYVLTVLKVVMEKIFGGILFTAEPEVKRNLSKKASNIIEDYGDWGGDELIEKVCKNLNTDRESIKYVPWDQPAQT